MVRLASILLTTLVVFYTRAAAPDPIYPQNPSVTEDAIFVSSQGVKRFDRANASERWHVLPDTQSFEPVVGKRHLLIGSTSGLYALSLSSGETLWHIASKAPIYSPVINDNLAYAGSQDGQLRAIVLDTGKILWQKKLDGWVYPPAIVGDRVITGGSAGEIYAFDAHSGDNLWSLSVNQELVYRPIPAGEGQILVTTFSGDIIAVDAIDGREVWRQRDPVSGSSPLISGDTIYIGGFDGQLRARDLDGGQLTATYPLLERMPFAARVYGDLLLLGDDQSAVALNISNGNIVWRKNTQFSLVASPVLVDGKVMLFSDRGHATAQPELAYFSNR